MNSRLRHIALTETQTRNYRVSRYYAGSRRIAQATFNAIKWAAELDSLATTNRAGVRRFHCVARISPTVLRSISPAL